ncbi:helix-turn-helix transcriptional regulator [Pasteurella skyensis]|uniref:Helix-turn-helix transcriptional regulator n=1 Tax=Phocoenobacter skyensis TaxID=97481 RepID=A0AAJ6NAC2_9PAST|nr:helix-turn-helix transcriptional regulator [Pasteurella skyensis]MDP8173152.1 helix-turn-helix transcriptional regulator [Pasteurella skyensis]MDP8178915.1 helix-turn-helix transcriptional regulator [Pasteurella skyensis]
MNHYLTLAERLQNSMVKADLSQQKLAEKVNISQQAIGKMLIGETRNPRNLVEIANVLGVNPVWLKTGIGSPEVLNSSQDSFENGVIRVSVLDIYASAGDGELITSDFVEEITTISYKQEYFQQIFNSANAEFIKLINVKGDSMSPTFESGDLVFVDTSINRFDGDGVYIFNYNNELRIKRLQRTGEQLLVISDNSLYREWSITKEDEYKLVICAKVLYSQSQKLKKFG